MTKMLKPALDRLNRLGIQQIAPGVFQLHHILPNVLNTFFLTSQDNSGGVLVDAGTIFCGRRITNQIDALAKELRHDTYMDVASSDSESDRGVLSLHVLTHVHPDHNGASKHICTRYGVPYWVGEGDADVAEGARSMVVGPTWSPFHSLPYDLWSGAGHPVDRRLKDDDEILDTGFIQGNFMPGAYSRALW
eukprot:CAMPEP_0114311166 /NCGR_PEP_ID=MMETSP0059-20121206/19667_1 /TAXON_ID=36894 /ORGANISM="Pyramimonas parkeae, Strain CCMP726" /LENGTH=190 /DNA_ID=CAMNT_0001435297 /DNA_START=69 /DNA_END=638 /DNA_ORIENTATION=+